jgi:HAD superfamily hydrolase (TIGR01509 family)
MKRKKINGILFDFDGTLTYPGSIDFDAIKKEIGCPQDRYILEYIEKQTPERREKLRNVLELWEDDAAEESVPNEGAEVCLSILKQWDIPMGIFTRNSMRSVQIALTKFKSVSEKDFNPIISRENSIPKPHPDGVLIAAWELGIPASELLVIGDFRFDIIAGNAGGALTVLLTNYGKSNMLSGDPEPDYIIDNLEQILGIIKTG